MVILIGPPEEVGKRYGAVLSHHIRTRIEEHHQQRAEQKRPSEEDRAKAWELLELLQSEVPHWILESEALAAVAGIDFMDLMEVNGAVPLTTRPSCTSFMVLGDRAERGYPLLLKIRDERPQHQAMGYRRLPDTHGMLFGADACNMGVGQGCNEHGLAVANNSGGLVTETAGPLGLNDCHVTRLLLERASTVGEAHAVFEDLVHRNKVGLVDGVRGMIFLLADSAGKGLIIEATRDQYESLEMDSGLAVWANHWMLEGSRRFTKPVKPDNTLFRSSVTRYERGRSLLEGKATVRAQDLESISRDEQDGPFSLCNGSDVFPWRTVSAFLYELDPDHALPVRVAPGLPSRVKFRDVPRWREDTPLSYLLEWTG
jgi:hypothetical protein